MNFFDSSEDTSYEVKDPDLLRMQSQNEKLKEALDEANQTVKQIQNVFTAQTVSFKATSFKATSLRDPRIYRADQLFGRWIPDQFYSQNSRPAAGAPVNFALGRKY